MQRLIFYPERGISNAQARRPTPARMHDIRFALRQLLKSPGFAIVAILTLGLGIGACTAIFTVVNSVLLKPIEYPESENLVVVNETKLPEFPTFAVSPANFRDYAKLDAFENSYASRGQGYVLTGNGEPQRLTALRVTGNYFATLKVEPALGHAFGPAEDVPGKENVVVLSHGFWQRQFAGDPAVIGQSITLNGTPFTITGVMPKTFRRGTKIELWTPLAFNEQQWANRGGHDLAMVARLKPGVTVAQAAVQVETLAHRLAEQYPDTNKQWGALVIPILENNTRNVRTALFTLLGAVGVLLLIACANVANLLLARATTRQREFSIRAALGAGRRRLVKQLLTESMVLGILGGALGLLIGQWGLAALLAIAPSYLPRLQEISLDGRALGFTFGLVLLTSLGFGLVPALQGMKVNLVNALKDGARGSGDGGHRHWLRSSLVVLEIALAVILLSGAGMLMRSFARLVHTSPGFDPKGALWMSIGLPGRKYDTNEKQVAAADALLERVRRLPGVTSAGLGNVMPYTGSDYILGLEIEGRAVAQSDLPNINYYSVSPDYFKSMGIPLLRGRDFTPADRANTPRVVIVSQSLANQYFPGQDPLGKRINVTDDDTPVWREIVAVVGDIKNESVDQVTQPQVYETFAQAPSNSMQFAVRTSLGDPTTLASALRGEVYAFDPGQPVTALEPMTNRVAQSMDQQRFAATLFSVFSGIALLLAAIGIYGIMTYAVSQRTQEFGVRLAIGASRQDILGLVLSGASRLILFGIAAGVAGALATARVIQSLLFNTSARDPLVLGVISLLLAGVALIACLVPARRATRVDPMVALRNQ
jgi:putative ABC transport system permease protein